MLIYIARGGGGGRGQAEPRGLNQEYGVINASQKVIFSFSRRGGGNT